jgi:uncharacterized membrane protein
MILACFNPFVRFEYPIVGKIVFNIHAVSFGAGLGCFLALIDIVFCIALWSGSPSSEQSDLALGTPAGQSIQQLDLVSLLFHRLVGLSLAVLGIPLLGFPIWLARDIDITKRQQYAVALASSDSSPKDGHT